MVRCSPASITAMRRWRCRGSEVERRSVCRPEAASESPRGVKTRSRKKITSPKNAAVTMSKSRHWRTLRLEGGKFDWPIGKTNWIWSHAHLVIRGLFGLKNRGFCRNQKKLFIWSLYNPKNYTQKGELNILVSLVFWSDGGWIMKDLRFYMYWDFVFKYRSRTDRESEFFNFRN